MEDDRSRVLLSAVVGAAAGAVFGYLYLTESGRRFRAQIDPKLDDFMREMQRMRSTIQKARAAADEGWRSLTDLAGGGQAAGGREVAH